MGERSEPSGLSPYAANVAVTVGEVVVKGA